MSQTRHKTSIQEIQRWLANGVSQDEVIQRLIDCDGMSLRRAQARLMVARGYGDTIAVDEDGNPLPDEEQRKLWQQQLRRS